jgi:hypothetical protein
MCGNVSLIDKPMTNYERIKNMSVEEMAKLLYELSTDQTAPEKVIKLYHTTRMTQKECFERWLLQEVSDE